MPADIYFLNHSGFILKIDDIVLVFAYYKDPLQHVEKMYFFVSHFHGDHFNPSISRFEEYADGYILHRDCDLYLRDAGKMHLMDVGDSYSNEDFTVKMYGSTDAGGSFLIHCHGITIFHAGDLNWWHWAGDSDAANLDARNNYFAELEKLSGGKVDIAMFQVDARLQVAREWGVKKFLSKVESGLLIPMHAFGNVWAPSYEFRWLFPDQKIWIPQKDGDMFREE